MESSKTMEVHVNYHSDGSYELVDFDEHLSAESKSQGSGNEKSDVDTDVDSPMDYTNDYSDDGSYIFVDSDEAGNKMIESKENPSADCQKGQRIATESSDVMSDADIRDISCMGHLFQFNTVAYQRDDDDMFVYPANFKLRANMEIKDVVKDHVLPFLPAKSLVKFRVVSKDWDKWIASPFLAHKQSHFFREISGFFRDYPSKFISLDRSAYGVPKPTLSFLPEPVVIRSSCNGLLLCQGHYRENMYYICNPANNGWKMLPPPKYYHGENTKTILVFDPSFLNFAADYQVVCAVPLPLFEGPFIFFEIYDSVTNSWKISAVDCLELGDSVLGNNGFYSNGIAYWETSEGDLLLAFDIKNGICGVQPMPRKTRGIKKELGVVSGIGGEVCYMEAYHHPRNNECVVDIYGGYSFSSLRRTIHIDLDLDGTSMPDDILRILPCAGSDIVAILTEDFIYTYHLRMNLVNKVKVWGKPSNYPEGFYFPYVNTLACVIQ